MGGDTGSLIFSAGFLGLGLFRGWVLGFRALGLLGLGLSRGAFWVLGCRVSLMLLCAADNFDHGSVRVKRRQERFFRALGFSGSGGPRS